MTQHTSILNDYYMLFILSIIFLDTSEPYIYKHYMAQNYASQNIRCEVANLR